MGPGHLQVSRGAQKCPDPACTGTHLAQHLHGASSPKHVLGLWVPGCGLTQSGFMKPSLYDGFGVPLLLLSGPPHHGSISRSWGLCLQNINSLTPHPSLLRATVISRLEHHGPSPGPLLPTWRPEESCTSLSLGRASRHSAAATYLTSSKSQRPHYPSNGPGPHPLPTIPGPEPAHRVSWQRPRPLPRKHRPPCGSLDTCLLSCGDSAPAVPSA